MPLTLAGVKKMVDAAEAKANEMGVKVSHSRRPGRPPSLGWRTAPGGT